VHGLVGRHRSAGRGPQAPGSRAQERGGCDPQAGRVRACMGLSES